MFDTPWIKLEVIGDDYNLQPDPFALVEAAEILIKNGFKVLPYCTDDLILCQRLLDVGCEVLMPWGSPIGTGQGLLNRYNLRTLRERIKRSEEHTSELQSRGHLVCRLLLEKKNKT